MGEEGSTPSRGCLPVKATIRSHFLIIFSIITKPNENTTWDEKLQTYLNRLKIEEILVMSETWNKALLKQN